MRLLTILLFSGIFLLVGCDTRRDILDPASDETAIELSVKWNNLFEGVKPTDVRVIFYPQSGGEPIERTITDDYIKEFLPADTYDILIYNQPPASVCFRGLEQFSTSEAYVEEEVAQKEHSLQPIAQQPTMLYSVGVAANKLTEGTTLKLDVSPRPRVSVLNFKIKIEGMNPDNVDLCHGEISYMSPSINLVSGEKEMVPFRHVYEATPTAEGFQFTVMTFGVISATEAEKEGTNLNLMFTTKEGNEIVKTIDVSKELDKVLDENKENVNVDVNIEAEVETPQVSITATVIPWNGDSGSGEIEQ